MTPKVENDPAPLCRVRQYRTHGFTVLELHGEIDLTGLSILLHHIEEATAGREPCVVVDLTHITFLDASGLRVLSRLYRRTLQHRGTAAVVCPSGFVRRVLELAKVPGFLTTVRTLDEALVPNPPNSPNSPNPPDRTAPRSPQPDTQDF
ncbi:STAS domain-containing protein [Phaeacidiphilus oryzae]|uniref:STAS domain-containing protein n=1 Tax=Phaeacidiphilus oryzae TaxID=348818 RepID=UPI00068C0781|nr:STAS domain-containing protein [Phaeacidiphilus oryzae]